MLGIIVWFINWVLSVEGLILGSAWLKAFVDLASVLAIIPLAYFAAKGTRWFFDHLLWRLRRRLLVTYFLLGVLPLLLVIALVAAVAMISVTTSSLNLVSRQLDVYLENSKEASLALAKDVESWGVERLSPDQLRARLVERATSLERVFPGLSIGVHRTGPDSLNVDAVVPENVRGVAERRGAFEPVTVTSRELPRWVQESAGFNGLVVVERAPQGTREVRIFHLTRLTGREGWLLRFSYPLGEELCQRLSKTTGLQVSPGHAIISRLMRPSPGEAAIDDREIEAIRREFRGYPVVRPIIEWETGRADENEALSIDRSFLQASHIWGRVQQFRAGQFGSLFYAVISGLAVIFLLIALVAIVSAMYLTRSITGAVHNLYRGTQRIEAGDLDHEIPIRGNDQLSGLAVSFNRMTSSVRELLRVSAEKQRLDQEMRIAADVQQRLFPREAPKSTTLDLAPGACLPARSVSGDYYDFLDAGPGLLGIVVADVCGKGVSAALMMANLQANLHGQVLAYSDAYRERMLLAAPSEPEGDIRAGAERVTGRVHRIVDRVNRQIVGSMMDANYVTLFYGEFDERSSTLQYTNAGHNPPLLLRRGEPGVRARVNVERLDRGGTVLGLFRDVEYEDVEVRLESGDLLVAFTDGLVEARNPLGHEFSEERLILLLENCMHLTAGEIERLVLQSVREWTAGAEQEDDLTLVVLKRK